LKNRSKERYSISKTNQDQAETIRRIQELALKILVQLTKAKLDSNRGQNPNQKKNSNTTAGGQYNTVWK
jgi:hypothetical protein